MSDSPHRFAVDLDNCDREPIHVPGSIQPHGVLISLTEPDLCVMQASRSLQDHLGCSPETALGVPLAEVIGDLSASVVRGALAHPRSAELDALEIFANGDRFDGIVHRHDGVAILELEPGAGPSAAAQPGRSLREALTELQHAETLAALQGTIVASVRALTGFERVMLYRFDDDGHGSVEAEARLDALEPYLGLHYPASDIPRQARELYLRSWVRLIPDARYTPSPLVPVLRPDCGMPLDLGFAILRSVSPIHLEYLANMGVRASMSISLVVHGRLYGLISCVNHSEPRFVPHAVRAACEVLGRLVSLQIAALDERERARIRTANRSTIDAIVDAMARTHDDANVLDGAMSCPDALLSLVGADGAVVVGEGPPRHCGRVPSDALVGELARWLESRGEREPFATDALPSHVPAAVDASDVACGLLSIALPGTPSRRLMWFRPEIVRTVEWGGDPRKPAQVDTAARLHPRRSFERWKQDVRLRARPFTPSDLEAAEELRRRAVELDLARQLERSRRAVRLRDDLVAVVSHDLKNPLSIVQMQASVLLTASASSEDEPARRLRAGAERIQRAVDTMNALVTDLLDLGKIEAGRFELQRRRLDLFDLVREAVVIVRPLAESKHVTISDPMPVQGAADLDRERIFQVLANVLGNAVKFTPEGGRITVEIRCVADELWVRTDDTGPGIPEEERAHVFDRYWQAPQRRRNQGSGLGLFIARSIVEAHGGRIWADRSDSGGARVIFAVPRAAR